MIVVCLKLFAGSFCDTENNMDLVKCKHRITPVISTLRILVNETKNNEFVFDSTIF